MALNPALESFRDWAAAEYGRDGAVDAVRVLEGAEAGGADLSVRICVGNRSYYEARVCLEEGELQVGFGTESRVVNEAIEEAVLDAGGDLDDLLGDELCDLGEEPLPMAHFFERPAFRFVVRLPLERPEALREEALRKRVRAIVQACRVLFQACVDEA